MNLRLTLKNLGSYTQVLTVLTININNKIVKDSNTVTPNDILSPDSGGSKKTSKVRTAINTHGNMKFIM